MTKNVYRDTGTYADGRLVTQLFYDSLASYLVSPETPTETWTFTYDAFGREKSTTRTNAGSGATLTVVNAYDHQGRLVFVHSPEGIVSYAFNDLGRMTATMVGLASNPIRRTSYSYDVLGRLSHVEEDLTPSNTNDPTLETDYHYNLEGNLVRTELPSGNIEAIDYDSLGRVIGMTDYDSKGTETVADDTKVAEYDYTLRADGRKVQSVEKFWKGSDANPFVTNTLDYEYDGLNRLTRETLDSTDNALDYRDDYVFDLTGNRLQKKHDVGIDGTIDSTTTSNFDANDRLLSEIIDQLTGTDSLNTYGYTQTQQTLKTSYTGTSDVAANRLSAMSFEYDLQGRLKTATTNTYTNGSVTRVERTSYDYNRSGIRVSAMQEIDANHDSTFESRVRTEFLNDASNHTGYSQVLRETHFVGDSNQILKQIDYSFGHDEISQTTKTFDESTGALVSTETFVFGHDGHGSVRVLLDAVGAMSQMFVFDAYGNMAGLYDQAGTRISGSAALFANAALAKTTLLYSGEQFDVRIGQQYLRARYYDSTSGRFNRLDPFFGNQQDPQSFHKYGFGHGNPVMNTDPTGMFSFGGMMAGMAIGGLVGGLSGAAIGGAYAGITGRMTVWQGMKEGAIIGAILGSLIGGGIGVGVIKLGTWIGPAVGNLIRATPAVGYTLFIAMSEWKQSRSSMIENQIRQADDSVSLWEGKYFGGEKRSREIVKGLAGKINNNAAGVPPLLLASVMLGELYHMNIIDLVVDSPNNPDSSVGYTQINARTVLGHNHAELNGMSASEIGHALLDPERAVDILSYEIRYYANNQEGGGGSLTNLTQQWNNIPGMRQSIVEGMSTAKDRDKYSILYQNHTGQGLLGGQAYQDLLKSGILQ